MCRYIVLILLYNLMNLTAHAEVLRDAQGHVFDTQKTPRRIVSTFLGADEILLEILGRSQQKTRLLALSQLADDPKFSNCVSEAKSIPHRAGIELENLVGLKPDLVIAATFNRPEIISALEKAKIPVFVMGSFDSLADIYGNILLLGKLTGAEEASKALADEYKTRLIKLKNAGLARTFKPTFLSYHADGYIMGKKTTFTEILETIGGRNLAADRGLVGWSKLNEEALAKMNPDYIILTEDDKPKSEQKLTLRNSPGWGLQRAVRQDRFIEVSQRELMALSHHVIKAMEKIHSQLPQVPFALSKESSEVSRQ